MPSKAYQRALEEATRHHARSKTYSGKFLRPHKPWLLDVIREHEIRSAVDYGCGKGEQYSWVDPADGLFLEDAFGFEVAKYDPAWPPFASKPEGAFDLAICTHVLGSIPVEDLGWVFAELFAFGTKAIYIAEKIGDVGKQALSAPDLRPVGWTPKEWLDEIMLQISEAGYEGTAYFSAREVERDGGVRTRRWRFGMDDTPQLIFDTSVQS